MVDTDTIHFLRECGSVAKFWRHRNLFYALKDVILRRYGTFYAYDLQEWDDDGEDGPGDVWATHYHVLKVVRLGEVDFHVPTSEYYYFNYAYQNGKQSPNYQHFSSLCRGKMMGRKRYGFPRPEHYRMLKYLVKHHGHLLK